MSDAAPLPPYAPRGLVQERLPRIFPEGTPSRTYCVRELAASTVFTALYIGAVEGSGRHLAPKHVYRMTAEQAARPDLEERDRFGLEAVRPGFTVPGARWYADNTREPIRDETLREGLVAVGAVLVRSDLATTSAKPRYALRRDFAALFDPALRGDALEAAIRAFQQRALTAGALARISILRAGAGGGTGILVTFPGGETRQLAPGPSSLISRAVIEVFAPRFLERPAVLWLSESGNRVVARDDRLAAAIGLKIEADKVLPDIILADLGPAEPLLVFVEVVATDGPVTPRRMEALQALTDAAGFFRPQVLFVTAYQDRGSAAFRKTASALAWGAFVWFASEPDNVLIFHDPRRGSDRLSDLIRSSR